MGDYIYFRTPHPFPKVTVFLKYHTHLFSDTLLRDIQYQQQCGIFKKNKKKKKQLVVGNKDSLRELHKSLIKQESQPFQPPHPHPGPITITKTNTHTCTHIPPVSNALLRQLSWLLVTLASLILFDGLSVLAFCLHTDLHSRV